MNSFFFKSLPRYISTFSAALAKNMVHSICVTTRTIYRAAKPVRPSLVRGVTNWSTAYPESSGNEISMPAFTSIRIRIPAMFRE